MNLLGGVAGVMSGGDASWGQHGEYFSQDSVLSLPSGRKYVDFQIGHVLKALPSHCGAQSIYHGRSHALSFRQLDWSVDIQTLETLCLSPYVLVCMEGAQSYHRS